MNDHLRPVGKPAPPRPRRPDSFISVKIQTTLDVTPEQVHQIGLDGVAELNRQMAEIRKQLGWQGTKAQFHEHLREDGAGAKDELVPIQHSRNIKAALEAAEVATEIVEFADVDLVLRPPVGDVAF